MCWVSVLHSQFAQTGAKGLRDSILQSPGNCTGAHKTRDSSHLTAINIRTVECSQGCRDTVIPDFTSSAGLLYPPGGFAKALPHAALCRAPEVKIPICLLDQHWLPIFGNPSHCYKPYMHGLRGNPCSQLEQRALALMLRVWLGGSSWGTAKPQSSSCLHSSL